MRRDTLFRHRGDDRPFRFDGQVAEVFPDMIRRSVPGYGLTLEMIEVISGEHVEDGSLLYDLGSSLGDATAAMRRGACGRRCRVIAVDNAPAMVWRHRERLRQECDTGLPPVDLLCADITALNIVDASVVTLNFTLQFIATRQRLPLLRAIRHGMRAGGALLISEKVSFEDEVVDSHQQALHTAFKRWQGYSELEISRKREALEDVLVPESVTQHLHRLQLAGFARVMPWFQCFNFVSLLAIR